MKLDMDRQFSSMTYVEEFELVVKEENHWIVDKFDSIISTLRQIASGTGSIRSGIDKAIAWGVKYLPNKSHMGEWIPLALQEVQTEVSNMIKDQKLFLFVDDTPRIKRNWTVVVARWITQELKWRQLVLDVPASPTSTNNYLLYDKINWVLESLKVLATSILGFAFDSCSVNLAFMRFRLYICSISYPC